MSENKMNIYEKLSIARVKLQELNLKKTGVNKHKNKETGKITIIFEYYELSDILPSINKICMELKMCPVIKFTTDIAEMTIYNCDDKEDYIKFESPIGSAKLLNCHEVQNIGAVQTFQRRYLYFTAFEVTENDILDATLDTQAKTQTTDSIKPKEEKSEAEKLMSSLYFKFKNGLKMSDEQIKTFLKQLHDNKKISTTYSKNMTIDDVKFIEAEYNRLKSEVNNND